MRVLFLLVCPAILSADTLVLKSGPPVSGTYAGGTARSIRFVVGEQLKSFAIDDVVRVVFDNGSPARPPSVTNRSEADRWRKVNGDEAGTRSLPDAADKQRKFCEAIQDYRKALQSFTNEPNPIKRAEMRRPDPFDFEPRIEAVMGDSGRFDNWTGTVRFHVEGRHVAVSFFPDCQGFPQSIEFATVSRYVFGSKDSNTMVPLHSPIAQALSQTNGNQTVVASGHLFHLAHGNMGNFSTGQKAELRQRYRSAPNYPPASVASPHYLAAFDSVVLKR
jgi:hypothetical protein